MSKDENINNKNDEFKEYYKTDDIDNEHVKELVNTIGEAIDRRAEERLRRMGYGNQPTYQEYHVHYHYGDGKGPSNPLSSISNFLLNSKAGKTLLFSAATGLFLTAGKNIIDNTIRLENNEMKKLKNDILDNNHSYDSSKVIDVDYEVVPDNKGIIEGVSIFGINKLEYEFDSSDSSLLIKADNSLEETLIELLNDTDDEKLIFGDLPKDDILITLIKECLKKKFTIRSIIIECGKKFTLGMKGNLDEKYVIILKEKK